MKKHIRSAVIISFSLFLIVSLIFSQKKDLRVVDVSGDTITINAGSVHGVKDGFTGRTFIKITQSGGQNIRFPTGLFEVISVSQKKCQAKITRMSHTDPVEENQIVTFEQELIESKKKEPSRSKYMNNGQSEGKSLIEQGKENYKKGRYREAIINFLEAQQKNPIKDKEEEIFLNLSLSYYALNKIIRAEENLNKLFRINSSKTINEIDYPLGFIEIYKKIKSEYENRFDIGIEWVEIPSGSFQMGDNFNEGNSDERPVHSVYLDAYYISKYEVTFDQYDTFCEETGRNKPDDRGWGRGDRPVIYVDWNDAKDFCDWLSQKTGEDIHLPTEAQWEKAARGTDQRRYPWGNGEPNGNRVNFADINTDFKWKDKSVNDGYKYTAPVGSYPAGKSPYGVHDMAGNVWEWCQDWYDSDYYDYSPSHNPQGPSSGSPRVTRGGSWYNNASPLRSAYRYSFTPSLSNSSVGFRLCKEK